MEFDQISEFIGMHLCLFLDDKNLNFVKHLSH